MRTIIAWAIILAAVVGILFLATRLTNQKTAEAAELRQFIACTPQIQFQT